MPVSVDVKEVELVPNSLPAVTVKGLPEPHGPGALAVLCNREHSLLPPTLQMVTPFMSPTVHLKVKVSPGQVGGAGMNCPVTSAGKRKKIINIKGFIQKYTECNPFLIKHHNEIVSSHHFF